MSVLRELVRGIHRRLTSYRFNPDHRADLRIIERTYAAYRARIESHERTRYLWRSVCQYRCQYYARSRAATLLANAAALLGVPLLLLLVRPCVNAPKERCEYLKINFHPAYVIPEAIKQRTLERRGARRYLRLGDLAAALQLFVAQGAFYPELLFKFVLWIASVRPHLDRVDARGLVQYCEYSAHSSLRKLFLNSHGVRLVNVTHGEEFISCRSAFSSFDEYHAWELTPRSVHDSMHIECGERFAFNPCAGLAPAPVLRGTPVLGFLWPAIPGDDLDALLHDLNALAASYKVVVRAHPNPKYANHFARYRDRLAGQCSDACTESVHAFIDRCNLIAGYLSAVLLQAVYRGRSVVYLADPTLASLRAYHEYYRSVRMVEVRGLAVNLAPLLEQTRCP